MGKGKNRGKEIGDVCFDLDSCDDGIGYKICGVGGHT